MQKYKSGLIIVIIVATLATVLSKFILVGSITLAIILGIIVGNSITLSKTYDDGISYAQKSILSFAIALMGVNLDFSILSSLGIKTLFLIIAGMIVTIYSAILLGKIFKIDTKLALLLGIGNGVCGSSAISAAAPVIAPQKHFIGLSVAIINLLGTVGMFLVPAIAVAMGLNEVDSGILIGNTLQAVGQVTAAGFSINDTAGISATTVKMGRVLLLTPLILILIYSFSKSNLSNDSQKSSIPLFIIFFIIFSLLSSFGFIGEDLKNVISSISHIALLIAMSAIGLTIHFKSIQSDGIVALKLASLVFCIQILFSLMLIYNF